MKVVLYGNGSSGNHGCEAIVRGTVSILGTQHNYIIQSENAADDTKYGLNKLAKVRNAKSEYKKGFAFLRAYAKLKLQRDYIEMDGLAYKNGIKAVKDCADVALSIGGDNYCYAGAGIYAYYNNAYKKQGLKTVLWGCSVEPDVVRDKAVSKDLANYDLIVARESITYDAVKAVQKNTVLAPDPAFFMDAEPCDVDERLKRGNVIGLNISPMIISNEKHSGVAYANYHQLISYVLKNTDATIALIPHVVWETNDDRKVLRQLYEDFDRDERIVLVDDYNASRLKYIISLCDFFIGARTHATIAAYSSCVPTLVVGYSVKSRGIARDLFGTESSYVLPVQELTEADNLEKAFEKLYIKRADIRQHLASFLPDYLKQAEAAKQAIAKLL